MNDRIATKRLKIHKKSWSLLGLFVAIAFLHRR